MLTWQPMLRVQGKSTWSPEEWAILDPLHILLHVGRVSEASSLKYMLTVSSTFPSFEESPKFRFHCHLSVESHRQLRNSTEAGLNLSAQLKVLARHLPWL